MRCNILGDGFLLREGSQNEEGLLADGINGLFTTMTTQGLHEDDKKCKFPRLEKFRYGLCHFLGTGEIIFFRDLLIHQAMDQLTDLEIDMFVGEGLQILLERKARFIDIPVG